MDTSSVSGKHDVAAYSTFVAKLTGVGAFGRSAVKRDSTPDQSQPLMQENLPDTPSTQTQYASYDPDTMRQGPSDEKLHDSTTPVPSNDLPWTPIPLRTWFWVTYVCMLVAGAISLEVALHYSHKEGGWPTRENAEKGVLHYVYTLPAVGVAMILAGFWTWTDVEIKRLQPYVDLLHGDSPPQRSLLLDYTRSHNALVWIKAASNRHYVVALSAIMALLCLSFQPLSAALFSVRDVFQDLPETQVNNLQAISLNPAEQVQDLTSFLSASGLASASMVYGLGDPTFIHDGYTVGEFELPLHLATNGTVKTDTTAIFTNITCRRPDQLATIPNGSDLVTLDATFNGCQFIWQANRSSVHHFGICIVDTGCGEPDGVLKDSPLASVIFWYFASGRDIFSVSRCTPAITLQKVEVSVDLASNVTNVRPLSDLTNGQGPFMKYSGNITGVPLHGKAYNGLNWTNLTQDDPYVTDRASAVQQQLTSAVFQHVIRSATGLMGANNDTFASFTETIYTKYLSILARQLYFINATQPMPVIVSTFQKRLFLADEAVHILSGGMLLLALLGTISHLMHLRERRGLRLLHQPGTLASAWALIAQTPTAELLDGRQRPEEMRRALQNRRFRIDPSRMKIVTEDEPGYEYASSPVPSTLNSYQRALPQIPSSGE